MPDPTAPPNRPNARLRALMAGRGVDQTELAEVLGLPQASVSRRLTGVTAWRVHELIDVARYFGVGVADIIDPTPDTPTPEVTP